MFTSTTSLSFHRVFLFRNSDRCGPSQLQYVHLTFANCYVNGVGEMRPRFNSRRVQLVFLFNQVVEYSLAKRCYTAPSPLIIPSRGRKSKSGYEILTTVAKVLNMSYAAHDSGLILLQDPLGVQVYNTATVGSLLASILLGLCLIWFV